MADAVTTNILVNGFRNAVVTLTNFSDGTGETNVVKVDATSSGPFGVSKQGQTFYPGTHLTIWRVTHTLGVMSVRLRWKATVDQDALILAPGTDEQDFSEVGGLRVPAGLAGATGSIALTTQGAVVGASYTINLFLKKNVPTS